MPCPSLRRGITKGLMFTTPFARVAGGTPAKTTRPAAWRRLSCRSSRFNRFAGRAARTIIYFLCLLPLAGARLLAANAEVEDLLGRARADYAKGRHQDALFLVSKAIRLEPDNVKARFMRGRMYEEEKEHEKAVAEYTVVIDKNPREPEVFQRRGTERFFAGDFTGAVADFDQFLELTPDQRAFHWQRGIACYYAGMYEAGKRQFAEYEAVKPNDVENAVWHYLCVARLSGVEQARATLFPSQGDRRIPMAQIYALFAGFAKPDDILAAARADKSAGAELNTRLFNAHLYLGLYYEAQKDVKKAQEHIQLAANLAPLNNYMGQVALVHAKLLSNDRPKKAKAPKEAAPPSK